ncbi:MAG: dUTP diphosphatase [Planctomycetota bacterium]
MNAPDAGLRFKVLDPRARVPERKSALAAGLDLAACLPRGSVEQDVVTLEPGAIAMIPTGLAMAVNAGWEAQVRPRSGLAIRHGISVPNAPGTIDADYRGELIVGLINLSPHAYEITHGLRIAQLVIAPVWTGDPVVVEELDETDRGDRGFGSTGMR